MMNLLMMNQIMNKPVIINKEELLSEPENENSDMEFIDESDGE